MISMGAGHLEAVTIKLEQRQGNISMHETSNAFSQIPVILVHGSSTTAGHGLG
jgi:hypothetical protein